MSKQELLKLKKDVLRLYNLFLEAYTLEGSRGYRQDLRALVKGRYNRFMMVNNSLPEEHRIKCEIEI